MYHRTPVIRISTSRRSSRAEPACIEAPRPCQTTKQSLFSHFGQRRSRGKHYGQRPVIQSVIFLRATVYPGLETYDGVVPTDGAWGGGQRVRGAEQSCDGQLLVMDLVEELLHVLRPVLTASRPSQTMAQMGPLNMSFRKVN